MSEQSRHVARVPLSPESLAWRVNGEAVLLLGGGRALILQVAHPAVAAAVAQHSDYRADPWRRLHRTIDVALKIQFGDRATSRNAAAALRRRHAQVTGVDDRGRPYHALDPELLMWVQATLLDTSLLLYHLYVRRLDDGERARYYEEMKPVARTYGITDDVRPRDYAAFRDYWEWMIRDRLRVTDTTHEVADAVLRPDLPRLARTPARPAIEALRLVTIGTLPPSLRDELGLTWGPLRERLLAASQGTIRLLLPRLPGLVRRFPAARRAA
jgi:uncharacterized protein (DUF2236 family)